MLVVLVVLCSASSQEVSTPSSAPIVAATAPPNWSFGGGASVTAYDTSQYFGGVLLAQPSVQMNATAERRLVRGLWLMLQANVSFSDSKRTAPPNLIGTYYPSALSTRRYGGALGLRYQFELPAKIELSPFLMLAGEYLEEDSERAMPYYDSDGTYQVWTQTVHQRGASFAARVGIMFERELVSGLALRLGTTIAQAKVTVAQAQVVEFDQEIVEQRASIGLLIEPSLELRYRF